MLVEAFAVRTAAALDDAGVRWRLTKGAALAHLDYGDQLAERTFGDVDLVIHPDDWPLALDALSAVGLRRPAPELRPGYDLRYGKGATLIDERDREIDLHLRFAIGRFGVRSRMEELFERGDKIELAGPTIPVLAGPDRLLHACHHLVLGGSPHCVWRATSPNSCWFPTWTGKRRSQPPSAGGSMPWSPAGSSRHGNDSSSEIDHPAHRWARGPPDLAWRRTCDRRLHAGAPVPEPGLDRSAGARLVPGSRLPVGARCAEPNIARRVGEPGRTALATRLPRR